MAKCNVWGIQPSYTVDCVEDLQLAQKVVCAVFKVIHKNGSFYEPKDMHVTVLQCVSGTKIVIVLDDGQIHPFDISTDIPVRIMQTENNIKIFGDVKITEGTPISYGFQLIVPLKLTKE